MITIGMFVKMLLHTVMIHRDKLVNDPVYCVSIYAKVVSDIERALKKRFENDEKP
jgi:hypothetical protein